MKQLIYLNKKAGLYSYCNPTLVREDEFIKINSTKNSNTSIFFLAISSIQTLAPTQSPALAQFSAPVQAFASAPGLLGMYINIDLQRVIKLVLKLFIKGPEHNKASFTFLNQAFKALNPNLYYGSS